MDSTINLWSTRRELKKKTPKSELLSEIRKKTNKSIDLNNLTQPDLFKLNKAIGSSSGPMPVCKSKADYVKFLSSVVPGLKSANRLSKPSLRELAEEFDDKS